MSAHRRKSQTHRRYCGGGAGRGRLGGALQFCVSPQEEKPDSQKVIVGVEGWGSTVLCQPTGGKSRLTEGNCGGRGLRLYSTMSAHRRKSQTHRR